MRKYEIIFILDPDLEEGQAQSLVEKVKGIITQASGEVLKIEDWGKRKPKVIISSPTFWDRLLCSLN